MFLDYLSFVQQILLLSGVWVQAGPRAQAWLATRGAAATALV